MAGLLKRIHSGREEQRQARKNELERLLQEVPQCQDAAGDTQQTIIRLRSAKFGLAG